MYILALEIANFKYSLALLTKIDNDVTVCEFIHSNSYREESHHIITCLKHMMAKHSVTFNELAFIAVTTGPGSFTGVRLGLAAVIGLRLASCVPVIAMDSFMVCAYAAMFDNSKQHDILVILESRRHDQYCQLWRYDHEVLKPAMALQPVDVVAYCNHHPVHVIGNGIVNIDACHRGYNWTYSQTTMFDARHVAQLAVNQQNVLKHRAVKPYYLRSPDVMLPQQ